MIVEMRLHKGGAVPPRPMGFDAFLQNLPLLHSWDRGQTWNTSGFGEEHLPLLLDFLHVGRAAAPLTL